MIIEQKTFKNKNKILKMLGERIETLATEEKLKQEEVESMLADIEEKLLLAYSPEKFWLGLTEIFKKYEIFQDIESKIKNENLEWLQTSGGEAIDELIDEDVEAWQQSSEKLEEMDESNFEDWAETLPRKPYTNFVHNLTK